MVEVADYLPQLVSLVQKTYPGWERVTDRRFQKDESEYQHQAAAFAQERLNRPALQALLDAGDFAEFYKRLKSVANKAGNLLYLGAPRTGDLYLINQPEADPAPICQAVFDLLHGDGPSEARLDAFLRFVESIDLKRKWAFPTFYLFLLYPHREVFVKPEMTQWFLNFIGRGDAFTNVPAATAYVAIRSVFVELLTALKPRGAADLIDARAVAWVAYSAQSANAAFEKAVSRLQEALDNLGQYPDLVYMQAAGDEVIGRYGPLFAPDHLPDLTAEEFQSFLHFKNNRHWSSIHRHGSRITQDMPALRAALARLHDENEPLAARYNRALNEISGAGSATLTPVLLVMRPEHYGVWNELSQEWLIHLKIWPDLGKGASAGTQYAAVNDILLRLAATLDIDLWTLDLLWEWFRRNGQAAAKLAAPFNAIFADRAQAEWAFGLLAQTVERLGGGPDDERFALTLRFNRTMMRLNLGNWMIMDISARLDRLQLTLLVEPMEAAFDFRRGELFARAEGRFAVFAIPLAIAREWPPALAAVYDQSMREIDQRFRAYRRSVWLRAHEPKVFEALFDSDARRRLLDEGLSPPPAVTRFWRITLPADAREDWSDGRGAYNFWADCLAHSMAAISFDGQEGDPQIIKFADIQPGDRVVAFLRNKTIGGIGTVTSPLDEQVALERPTDQDYFRGSMWLRIGVDWQPGTLNVDALPENVRKKFSQQTVMELTREEFEAVERLMTMTTPASAIAHEFKGFTRDAFAFLEELRSNNSKVWMDANRDRWQQSVFAPMRDLFADVGRAIKPLFDPYLEPDRLEVRPTVRNVLARINRNWSARISGPYYDYYWGAFYRERLSRQEDAQLHITLWPENLRFGFYIGEYIKDAAFKQRLQADPAPLYAVIRYLELDRDFAFERVYPDGRREGVAITAPDDLREWIATGDYNLLQRLTPDETVALGPALADRVYDALRRVFPVYLWAVNDDPVPLVERYLAAEFPDPDVTAIEPPPPSYTRADFLRETYLTEAEADDLLAMLEEKRQVIFTGPPGTGKTYVARRLAKLLIGLADPPPERLTIVQFHPAYGYEEFIEGIRPTTVDVDGRKTVDYPVRKGAFVRFCQEAARRPNERCVFIIDEINRGNVPRIFGELMLLLEYRDETVPLPYSGDPFRIPPNVYLIGTMNTADRSIALVDFALRRRFYFRRFAADPALLRRWLAAQSPALPYLERLYEQLVDHFRDDPDFAIGHSVFMQSGLTEAGLARIWRWSVLPYLREYHVEKLDEVRQWEWDHEHMRALRGAAGQGPGALPDSDAADEAGDTAEAWDDAAQNGAADGA